jgi:hypothetical protein
MDFLKEHSAFVFIPIWISIWKGSLWIIDRVNFTMGLPKNLHLWIDLGGLIGLTLIIVWAIKSVFSFTYVEHKTPLLILIFCAVNIVTWLVLSYYGKIIPEGISTNSQSKPKIIVYPTRNISKKIEYDLIAKRLTIEINNELGKNDDVEVISTIVNDWLTQKSPSPTEIIEQTGANLGLSSQVYEDGEVVKLDVFLTDLLILRDTLPKSYAITDSILAQNVALWVSKELNVSAPKISPSDDFNILREKIIDDPGSISNRLNLVNLLINFPGSYKSDEKISMLEEARNIALDSYGLQDMDEDANLMSGLISQREESYEEAEEYFIMAGAKGVDALNFMKLELGYMVEVLGRWEYPTPDPDFGTPWEYGIAGHAMWFSGRDIKTRPRYNIADLSEVEWMGPSNYWYSYIKSVPLPNALVRVLPELQEVVLSSEDNKDSKIEKFWNAVQREGFSREDILTREMMIEAVHIKEYDFMAERFWGDNYKGWLWYDTLKPFRKSRAFKQKVVESGMLSYWQKHGFPDLCHPTGKNDFECDLNSKY